MDDILPTKRVRRYDAEQDAVFVMTYVETGDPIVALTRAGIQDASSSIIATAEHYLARPDIRAAIAVVQKLERTTAPVKVTKESIIESCQAVFEGALRDRQYASATGALKLQAALMSLLTQKINISHSYDVNFMTDAELQRIAAGAGGDGLMIDGQFEQVDEDPEAA